jgi:hypothetical protein
MNIVSHTGRISGLIHDLKKPAIVEFLLNGNLMKGKFRAFKKDQMNNDNKFIYTIDCETKIPYILDADTIQSITII